MKGRSSRAVTEGAAAENEPLSDEVTRLANGHRTRGLAMSSGCSTLVGRASFGRRACRPFDIGFEGITIGEGKVESGLVERAPLESFVNFDASVN